MVDAVTVLLDYTNHSINIVLYCISGSRSRTELMKTLCCHRKTKVRDVTMNTMNSTVTEQAPHGALVVQSPQGKVRSWFERALCQVFNSYVCSRTNLYSLLPNCLIMS